MQYKNEDESTKNISSDPNSATTAGPPDAPAWRIAFTRQLNDAMLARVRSYARQRALGVSRAGGRGDDYAARELVQDAVADTFIGTLAWDPERSTLESHLTRAIQSRTNKERKRALKVPHERLGEVLEEVESQAAVIGANAGAESMLIAADLLKRARAVASRDVDVLRILDAYDALATTRAEVLAQARMRPEKYHRAHIRLCRIFATLTGEHAQSPGGDIEPLTRIIPPGNARCVRAARSTERSSRTDGAGERRTRILRAS